MTLLTAILTHLPAEAVRRQLDYLRRLSPSVRFAVCYGGTPEEFERLDHDDAVLVDDPALRAPSKQQSYNGALAAAHDAFVTADPSVGHVYVIEFDQLVLRGDFDRALIELAERTGAGLLAKAASPRNDTNWPHHLRFRDDPELNRFIARLSRRDDPAERWGCLGTGMLFTREALDAFRQATADVPHAYLELLIPTVVHHLGFDVVDVDAHGDLYAAVRWRPEHELDEAIAAKRAGRTFVHPFKRLDALDAIAAAPGPQNSSTAGSSAG